MSYNSQLQPSQSSGPSEPLQVFKMHVDLTEVFAEFFVGLAEKIIGPLCANNDGSEIYLEDYQSMGPQIFGDLVRVVFRTGKPGEGAGVAVVAGQQHWGTGTPTMFSLRRYFPTETQRDGGPAQELLEQIYMGICTQVSRAEAGAKHVLARHYPFPVDIIHTHYPEPYIQVSGEDSHVIVYGEVYPRDVPVPDKLDDEDLDETAEELAYMTGMVQPHHPHIPNEAVPKVEPIDTSALLATRF